MDGGVDGALDAAEIKPPTQDRSPLPGQAAQKDAAGKLRLLPCEIRAFIG